MLSYSEINSSRTWDLVLRVSVKTACSEGCKDRTDSKASLKDKTGVQNMIKISSSPSSEFILSFFTREFL